MYQRFANGSMVKVAKSPTFPSLTGTTVKLASNIVQLACRVRGITITGYSIAQRCPEGHPNAGGYMFVEQKYVLPVAAGGFQKLAAAEKAVKS